MPASLSPAEAAEHHISDAHNHHRQTLRFANLALPATPKNARTLRHWSAHTLSHWGLNHTDLDDALLVIGEFAANAIEHGGEDMSLALPFSGNLLTVAVSDNGTTGPEGIPSGNAVEDLSENEDGRGLMLVSALALTWGASALPGGGVVLRAELAVHR